jgi:hypothetical protein
VRVYVIARGYQAADIDTGEAAARFLAWLAGDTNPALTKIIQTWLMLPADAGGLGALADSPGDLAELRAGVIATWRQAARPAPDPRPAP